MLLRRGPLTAEIALIAVVLSWIVRIRWRSARSGQQPGDRVCFLDLVHAIPGFWFGMLSSWPACSGSAIARRWPAPRCSPALGTIFRSSSARRSCWAWGKPLIARMARSGLLESFARITSAPPAPEVSRAASSSACMRSPTLLQVITLSGIHIGFMLAGSIPIERAFATPGSALRCISRFTSATFRDTEPGVSLFNHLRHAEHPDRRHDHGSIPGSRYRSVTDDHYRSPTAARSGDCRCEVIEPQRWRRFGRRLRNFVRRSPCRRSGAVSR